jgi:transcriptional regulator with XRE-family HTH domain
MDVIVGRCLINDKLAKIGKTQTQLADELGMSRTQLSDYANNRMIMSLRVAKKLSLALKLNSVDELYEWRIIDKQRKE